VPEYEGEIQRVLAGCYTSMAPTKRKLRQVEAAIASAERWAAVAWWRHGTPYPADELRSAWKRIMLTAFHDVIAGALIENALPGVNDMLGYAGDVVRRIIVSRQHSLLPAVAPEPDTIPLYVLNPHPHPVKAHVGGNFLRTYATALDPGPFNLYAADGQRVAHQEQGGSPVLEGKEMQPYIGFVAEVPALSARRYLVRFETPAASGDDPFVITENAEGIVVESHRWTATFDAATGTLAQLTDHTTGRQLLTDPAEVQAMDDVATAWGGMTREIFSQQVGQFSPLSPAEIGRFVGEADNHQGRAVRVIHRGPVSITVECLTIWELTQAQVQYTFYAQLSHVDVNVRLFMQARQKMIKFVLPFDLPDVQVTCETPYGCTSRATDETEHSYSRWLRMDSPGISVGVTNNGQNGFHLGPSGKLGLSLTRGAVYAAWEDEVPLNPNRSYTFMDQETVDTRFRIAIGETSEQTTQQLIPLALELNQPLEFFFAYHTPTRPDNTPQPPAPFLQIEPNTIALGALKKADQGDALIVRLYESAGQKTTAHLSLDGDERQTVDFNPHEIKTWRITQTDDGVIWEPCNLLEEAIHPQSS
jgi:alpha-mannosidase